MDVCIEVSLDSAFVRDGLSASRFRRFAPKGESPGIHLIRGWVGPREVKILDSIGTELQSLCRPARLSYRGSHL
jgi:hypothetical protein